MKRYRIAKYFKIGPYGLLMGGMIALAAVLRIALISQNFPLTNSDEGTMGLMALHIAYHGEFPVFLYGQNYMGVLEAYIGAVLFPIFGPSLFTLRLGMVILFSAFQLALYLLISLLYTKRFALVSISLLCLGSPELFTRQLIAVGGALETLLFGALTVLLASYLILSYKDGSSIRKGRIMVYGSLGLVMGLGLWSHILIAPFAALALLFLLLYCRKELRLPTILTWLLGLLVGLFPALIFDVFHPSQNLPEAILQAFSSGGTAIKIPYTFWDQLRGTVLVDIPMATGASPICAIHSTPGAWRTQITACMVPQGLWGIGFLLLWLIATFLAIREARIRFRFSAGEANQEERQETRRSAARLLLLGSAGLTMLAFLISSAPALVPATSVRYLVGLEAALPAVLWPLWRSLRLAKSSPTDGGRLTGTAAIISAAALLCVVGVFLLGTIITFQQSSVTTAITQQQEHLIDDLLRLKVTRIYTDYWTCDRLAFLSDERIICSVVNDGLQPGQNRDTPYVALVRQAPNAAYVFADGAPQIAVLDQRLSRSPQSYRRTMVDGYIVFQPT